MSGDTGLVGLFWCALCGLIPLVVGICSGDEDLGFAAFIGAASLGAVGGVITALVAAIVSAIVIRRDARLRRARERAKPDLQPGQRPTRLKMTPVAPPIKS